MSKNARMDAWIFWGIIFTGFSVFAAPVPDTGQTTCYDNEKVIPCPRPGQRFYGQDANYTINPPSYTKLDENGNALPVSATWWVMVRDNVTGLFWEVKTDHKGLHDTDNWYTWYDPNPATNGGNAGTPTDGTDTDDFINAVNDEDFGGFSDWRLPSIKELASLVDILSHAPAVNRNFFPRTNFDVYSLPSNNKYHSNYWTSTTSATYPGHAWEMDFWYGYDTYYTKSHFRNFVRAVRGEQSSNQFVNNGDGTITDNSTGLMWQRDSAMNGVDFRSMNWEYALAYCQSLVLGGHQDWRLPTINELRSLVDYGNRFPAINRTHFPNTTTSDGLAYGSYWSSTTSGTDPDKAKGIGFGFGIGTIIVKSENSYSPGLGYVRAVRGGYSNTLGVAVDNTSLTWTTGGDADWYNQAAVSYYGGDAAQSGAITHNGTSWVQTTVTGPVKLSFFWKVSSEAPFDYLRFYIDAAEQTRISGNVDWQQRSYSIGSGSHIVKWAYTKDLSLSNGSDAGWLDRVVSTISTCPDCPANGVITNATYPAGTTCSCSNATSITLGSNVTVESGAIVTFTAPRVTVQPGFHAENGSTVRIKQ